MFKVPMKLTYLPQAIVVLVAVGVCATVLLLVRPWKDTASNVQYVKSPRLVAQNAGGTTVVTKASARTESATLPIVATQPIETATPLPVAPIVANAQTEAPKAEQPAASIPPQAEATPETPPVAEKPAAPVLVAAKLTDTPEVGADDPIITQATPRSNEVLSKEEVDEALKPLFSLSIPDSDIAALKELTSLIKKDNYSGAKPYLEKIKTPAAKKLALWYYYRAGASDNAEDIIAFRTDNPFWPSRNTLLERAEHALFWYETDPKKIVAFFSNKQPATQIGKAALGGALIKQGSVDEGRRLIRQAWREGSMSSAVESRFKDRYSAELRPEDHLARIDWLLVQDSKSNVTAIERLVPLINKKEEQRIKACIAIVKRAKNAGKLVEALSKEAKDNPATLLLRIQLARRGDKNKDARALLRTAPTSPENLVDPSRWWSERESQIRTTLNEGDAKSAYSFAKNHPSDLDPEDISDAEFLAGWIALRFLNEPKVAHNHFAASAAAGGLPYRRARAGYWAGRAEQQLGNAKAAKAYFAEASQHNHTFYGQLAYQMLAQKSAPLKINTYVRPTTQDIKAFNKLDVIQAIMIARKADLDPIVPVFLFDIARNLDNAPHMILTAELSKRIAQPNIAVRMAKVALNRGFPMERYAYPDALPQFKPVAKDQDLESALIHALTRQESEFHQGTVSSAGAVGLMQLLPSTAKEVARAASVKYEKKKLSTDPSYNVSLGSAFLHQLLRSYDGSYIMTLAAYNAGPGRVKQWVAQFGDPRSSKVDPIDWIERIPFTETRQYVHKIMESAQVYRWRLDSKKADVQLAQDLHRGRKDQPQLFLRAGAAN